LSLRKAAIPKNGNGFGANYSGHHPVEESTAGGAVHQDKNRHMSSHKNEMKLKVVSCSTSAGGAGASLASALSQQREIQRRSLELQQMTNAPDEPSELLVRPEKRQLKQNEMIDHQPSFVESQ
jgi:hypothetical protein